MNVADLFCGAGGTSTGVMQAARDLGVLVDLVAVNHWDLAIATHAENHPSVNHYNSDLENIDPRVLVPSGKLRLLVASPECTHFSRARGGKPMSKQSRASVKYVLRWVRSLDVEDVLIENVPDFLDWGPLDPSTLRPVKARKGEYFYRFVRKMEKNGYTVAWRILNAADYGDPTTRKRLFIIARKNKTISFPEPTHHKNGGDMFGNYPRWRSAREIIDWSIKGESIFNRKKPLAENTLRRLWDGLMKFGGKAFVLGQQSGAVARDIDQPVPTVAAAGAISFIEPFLVEYHGGTNSERRTRSIDQPLPTLDTSNRFALVEPFIITTNWTGTNRSQPRSIDQPIPTMMGHSNIGLVEPFLVEYYGTGQSASIDEPMKTLTGHDRFGLVEPIIFDHNGKRYLLDILYRMLQPQELARAMSFPVGYRFHGTREQVVKQIGNAVPVSLARELAKSLLRSEAM